MPEGLSAVDAGKGLRDHSQHDEEERERQRNRTISIIEASLLAVVAVLAAYSGWAAARFATDSSLSLSRAITARSQANAANLDGLNSYNYDVATFNDWFTAYVAGNTASMAMAEKRFTPNFRRAFDAWLGTDPATNPNAPPGPEYMPQYKRPAKVKAAALNAKATVEYKRGQHEASTSDNYVRTTVYLATILFLAGLGSHFTYRAIRYGLAAVGTGILLLAIGLLATSPKP